MNKVTKPKISKKATSTKVEETKTKTSTSKKRNTPPELVKMVNELNKRFGDNTVTIGFRKDEKGNVKTLQRIPTGSFSLDTALGGGIPVGRMTQISGAYSSTKTTQASHIIKNAQKLGYVCALVDVEGSCTDDYLQDIGIDTDSLIILTPDSLEEATESILSMQKSGLVHLAVLDSIAALSSNKEQESSMDETISMGITQKLLAEFCRKYTMNNNRLSREDKIPFTVIAINQLREKISNYGDPEYTPGGRAIGFTIAVDIRFRRGDWISEGTGSKKEIVGQVVKFKIDKNKTYKRMQVGEFDFYFSENNVGIPKYHNDYIKEIIMCAAERGVITRAGSWLMYNDMKFQGVNNLVDAMRNDTELVDNIKKEITSLLYEGVKND